MKKIISSNLLLFMFFALSAQDNQLWAIAEYGGINGVGTVVRGDINGNFQLVHALAFQEGAYPRGNLVLADNGYVYGVATLGGATGSCTLFRCDTGTFDLVKVHDFGLSPQWGEIPTGGLIKYTDGLIYGNTHTGGAHGSGTIFSLDPYTNDYADLYDFDSTSGSSGACSFFVADTVFYGTTYSGGTDGKGVIYSYNPNTGQYRVIYNIPDSVGGIYNVMMASDGKLYGTTSAISWQGAYSFDLRTNTFRILRTFDWAYEGVLASGFTQYSDGKLYLATSIGNSRTPFFNNLWGTIYSFDISADSFSIEAKLSETTGYSPTSALNLVGNGLLGGSCTMGGSHKCGTIFTFNPQTKVINCIFNFDSLSTGYSASGGVIATSPLAGPTAIAVTKAQALSLFPNPAQTEVIVENTTSPELLHLTNSEGRVVKTIVARNERTIIDISDLACGLYFINNKKFIKR